MPALRPLIAFWLCALFLVDARAAPVCAVRPQAQPALTALEAVMARGRFVTYQPTSLQIWDGRPTSADDASMEQDLKTLRPRFDGLITYSALNGAERIADIAARLGFRAVIVGIWDFRNQTEIDNAIASARRHPTLVRAIALGNETLFARRADWAQVSAAVKRLRQQLPSVAITVTEPFHLFAQPDAQPLLAELDLMTVNVHPVFQPWFRDAPDFNAADFVVKVVDQMADVYCGPILVKETGVPTEPAAKGYTRARQRSFYQALRQQFPPTGKRAFAYFDAFDAPWRAYDANPVPGTFAEEAHWGLFDDKRRPKPVVETIPKLPNDRATPNTNRK